MLLPDFYDIPSESTIECLSNHYILHFLDQPAAWMLKPTLIQEKRLGYDAWLCNTKVVVIQYKRVKYIYQNGDIRIEINPTQHSNLQKNFPRSHKPHAFYAFSDYSKYQDINHDYLSSGSPRFFDHTIFFDIHSLDKSDTSVQLCRTGILRAKQKGKNYSQPITHWKGRAFVDQIAECNLGQLSNTVSEFTDELVEDVENGRVQLNFLFWNLP